MLLFSEQRESGDERERDGERKGERGIEKTRLGMPDGEVSGEGIIESERGGQFEQHIGGGMDEHTTRSEEKNTHKTLTD